MEAVTEQRLYFSSWLRLDNGAEWSIFGLPSLSKRCRHLLNQHDENGISETFDWAQIQAPQVDTSRLAVNGGTSRHRFLFVTISRRFWDPTRHHNCCVSTVSGVEWRPLLLQMEFFVMLETRLKDLVKLFHLVNLTDRLRKFLKTARVWVWSQGQKHFTTIN